MKKGHRHISFANLNPYNLGTVTEFACIKCSQNLEYAEKECPVFGYIRDFKDYKKAKEYKEAYQKNGRLGAEMLNHYYDKKLKI